ncbi:MAG: peptidylprolyl isomerase [Bdellovibrionales bacterium]|nr:peptidylprolyl isomerase [Bdellovibrionales bacterium]
MSFLRSVSLVASSFVFLSGAVEASVLIERLEASVNASFVLLSDVVEFRKTLGLRSQLDPLFSGTSLASKGGAASDREIVAFLVDERLITEQFAVQDAEVEQEINSIQAGNRISRDALKGALKEQGFSFEQYFELIRASLSKRNLIDRDIRTKVHISEDDIKNHFYNQLPRNASLRYRLKVVHVDTGNYKSPDFAKDQAMKLLQDIRGGESFEDVAKRASDGATAESGGDLGFLSDDEISPLFQTKAKELKVGQISDVFGNTRAGFFILKLADIRSGQEDQLQKRRDKISAQLTTTEYQRQIALWLERERDKAYIRYAQEGK